MNSELVDSSFVYKLIRQETGGEFVVRNRFKLLFKESIILFIHYFSTYADENRIQKKNKLISIRNLKNALNEIDFYDLIQEVDEYQVWKKTRSNKRILK